MPCKGSAKLQREFEIQLGESRSSAISQGVREGQRVEFPDNKRSEEEVT